MEFLGDSSCVRSAGYVYPYLTVEFQDGKVYSYSPVHPFVYGRFRQAVSKGEFFNRNIRNNYSYDYFEGLPPDVEIAQLDEASKVLEGIMTLE